MGTEDLQAYNIPVISITGTNGKTTTTRMISHVFNKCGFKVGITSTSGIYIDGQCIEEGDSADPESARKILNSREVDVAVLETDRGGIIREGLAYGMADVAVKEDGSCILNADDPWIMKVRDKARGSMVMFSEDIKNPLLKEHVESGKIAIRLRNNDVYIYNNRFSHRILTVSDIPATMGGIFHTYCTGQKFFKTMKV